MKKKALVIFALTIAWALIVGLIAYVALPALNPRSIGFWAFITTIFAIIAIPAGVAAYINDETNTAFNVSGIATAVSLLIVVILAIVSGNAFHASSLSKVMSVNSEGTFSEDIAETNFNTVPVLDKDSAILYGDREMGGMIEYASQFDVAHDYTQINYKGKPYRISCLEYDNFWKWRKNRFDGIPGYCLVDMTTQEAEIVFVDGGIKYSPYERFGRDLKRYLRHEYPTYIFDGFHLEIDEEGNPFWICPVIKYTAGVWNGKTIDKIAIINAVSGEISVIAVKNAPKWVDCVFSAELLEQQYNWFGKLKNGWWNSLFSQQGCLATTEGYNYLAIDDDTWVYTGITSTALDESNVGFVLMNQRTREVHYYDCAGAEEYSAMDSARGQVQHMGYDATFPLLLNVGGKPTYFMALKDASGIVKQYAMINVQQYQKVAIGDTVEQVVKNYQKLNLSSETTAIKTNKDIAGKIAKIASVVIEGNSYYYIILEENETIYSIAVTANPTIVKYDVGEEIHLSSYESGELASADILS